MKHYFIINPTAGQGKALKLERKIWQAADRNGIDPVIHITKKPGEGEQYVRSVCLMTAERDNERLRFYACGGDGTLNEIVNGIAGFDNTEAANIPAGTGNDFIRNYPKAHFQDIDSQINGTSRACDLIRYECMCESGSILRFCVNMVNIGFDCNVVDETASLKKKPFLNGTLAYLAGVGKMLVKKKGADLRVEFDDGYVYDGKLLLAAIANGCYCGGGVKGIPRAVTDDGLIDVSLVKETTRRIFISLFPQYSKGTHLENPRTEDLVIYKKCTGLTVAPNGKEMKICVDGEIYMAGEIRFEIAAGAIRFVVPD